MTALWITLGCIAFLGVAVLVTAYICFYMTFYASRRQVQTEEYPIPEGEIYEAHREQIVAWQKQIRAMPRRQVSITSFDGLRLCGMYYEYAPDAPIEILFHGYRGNAERDLCGGVARCFALGRSALIVDQRAAGNSEGHVITFGVLESRDCLAWVDYVVSEINPNAQIILTGISMGASTVLIASAEQLPPNVVGVLADCGYTSARAIIKKVMREMRLPASLLYPPVRLGARLFGKFDPDERSPIDAVKQTSLPVIFFHGDTDDFVPHSMSVENYQACAAHKKLVTIENAGHGLCFPVDQEKYLSELKDFFDPILKSSYHGGPYETDSK